jgi:hypothetical protein
MVALVSEMTPVVAVAVSVPPHTVVELLPTVSPPVSVSLNATPMRSVVLAAGLVIVNVRAEALFSEIDEGLNALPMLGGRVGTGAVSDPAIVTIGPVGPVLRAAHNMPLHTAVVDAGNKFTVPPLSVSAVAKSKNNTGSPSRKLLLVVTTRVEALLVAEGSKKSYVWAMTPLGLAPAVMVILMLLYVLVSALYVKDPVRVAVEPLPNVTV